MPHFYMKSEVIERKENQTEALNRIPEKLIDDHRQSFPSTTSQAESDFSFKQNNDILFQDGSESRDTVSTLSPQSQNTAPTLTSYLTQVYFKPLFGSAEAMKELFEREGFVNIH